jgi:dCMP deaminase
MIDPKTLKPYSKDACLPPGLHGDPLLMGNISFGPVGSGRALMEAHLAPPGSIAHDRPEHVRQLLQSSLKNEVLVRKLLKFLPDAQAARGRSKDESTQVGAVVIDDDFNVRISGYNGMPRGVNDEVRERHIRPTKYLYFAHAEENCVAQAARIGVSLKGCTILLTSLFPCTTCSRLIIQSGIKRVLAPRQVDNTRWDEQAKVALEMLTEAGVEVLYYEVPK